MEMSYDSFVDSVARRGGVAAPERAEQMIAAVLRALGEVLVDSDRQALADQLVRPLGDALCERPADQNWDLTTFYGRIATDEQVHVGRARERAQVVGPMVARVIDPAVLDRIKRRLPDEFGQLFVDPHAGIGSPARPADRRAQANQHTLAGGRAGSVHPVSEAKPPAGQHGSIAAQDDPHGDTQLAGGHRSSDEDQHTVAGGKPGSSRSLSDTDDS